MSEFGSTANSALLNVDLKHVLEVSFPVMVSGAGLDSRAIVQGDAFVALQGTGDHGLTFLSQAKSKGAVVVLLDSEDLYAAEQANNDNLCLPHVLVSSLRSKLGAIARAVYGDVDQQIDLVGVTGTDGKTSITHFVAQLLNQREQSCAVLGTVGNGYLENLQQATHTTGDVFQVYQQLKALASQGAQAVAMEVSSHALDQDRVAGLQFDVAVLSNLGSDHLDYHRDLVNYANAKAQLFDCRAKICVLNIDESFGLELLSNRADAITYSAKGKDAARWRAQQCVYSADGIRCTISAGSTHCEVLLPLLGAFNVANVLAACAVVESLGVHVDEILSSLPTLAPVVGRAELLRSQKGSRVVIDYAHTAQALESILSTLRDHFSSRIWCVFGCGGDRDRSKRPAMAKAAMREADCLIVTSDNPRSENPQRIIEDVLTGINQGSSSNVHVEVDRATAIAYALQHAGSNDCVLIAGKGHEDYQVLADRTIRFSDREEVMSWQAGAA